MHTVWQDIRTPDPNAHTRHMAQLFRKLVVGARLSRPRATFVLGCEPRIVMTSRKLLLESWRSLSHSALEMNKA
jgi:hypothetical protein